MAIDEQAWQHRKETGCGNTQYGSRVLCEEHQAEAERLYPQGWRYYPGDTCRHGVYVGGCGIDWMCGRCEDGE